MHYQVGQPQTFHQFDQFLANISPNREELLEYKCPYLLLFDAWTPPIQLSVPWLAPRFPSLGRLASAGEQIPDFDGGPFRTCWGLGGSAWHDLLPRTPEFSHAWRHSSRHWSRGSPRVGRPQPTCTPAFASVFFYRGNRSSRCTAFSRRLILTRNLRKYKNRL